MNIIKTITTTAVLLSSLGFASITAADDEADLHLKCIFLEGVATGVMESRQDGIRITDLISNARKITPQPALRTVVIGIIKLAYEEPQLNTESAKARITEEFANIVATGCYKTGNG